MTISIDDDGRSKEIPGSVFIFKSISCKLLSTPGQYSIRTGMIFYPRRENILSASA